MLLFLTYRSLTEAAHVLLAVPFALTGGLYLVWILNYNFSVAVWVGFIALFGTAVQTTVVMVIYLEEAVARKQREHGILTNTDLREAVMEGALLRLRPKLVTVSTIIAGLLPIFWSTRVGSEVIRPLATPVLGGMVSSLAHVLIVTPIIFLWLRERELRRAQLLDIRSPFHRGRLDWKHFQRRLTMKIFLTTAIALLLVLGVVGCKGNKVDMASMKPITTRTVGNLSIVLADDTGDLKQGP